jgi:hypothetical protein
MSLPSQEGKEKQTAEAGGFRADLPWLAGLVVLAVCLRGWQLTHTEVASRDSIGYIRLAWQLENRPWAEVMCQAPQHPGYPLAVLAVSHVIRPFSHQGLATDMQWSAQVASALASVLLVIPMFYLGRELFNRRVGFWAAVLLQCLPSSGRGMADGLSEPAFLLGAASALACACYGLRRASWVGLGGAGVFGALAYLCRPEGGLLVAFTGFVLLAVQTVPRWRQPWRRVLLGGASLSLAAVAVGGPYAWTIGTLTKKHTGETLIKHMGFGPRQAEQAPGAQAAAAGDPLLAVWWNDHDTVAEERTWWGFVSLLEMLSKGFFYIFWVPTLAGLWWFRDRFRLVPGAWVMLLVSAMVLYLLYRVAQVLGYLSDRHTLLVLLCSSYFTAAGLGRFGELFAARLARLRPSLAGTRWGDPRFWSPALLALAAAGCLPRTLETLHADRVGFRVAGYWLAENTLPGDYILDPYSWANYYAGHVFTEGRTDLKSHHPPIYYLVVEQSQNKHSRLPEQEAALRLAEKGKPLHSWKVKRGKERGEIVVYELPGIAPPKGTPGRGT